MKTARVIATGNSQSVRLPRGFRLEGKEVFIKKIGNTIMLVPCSDPWAPLISSLDLFTSDFMQERAQPPRQRRKGLPL